MKKVLQITVILLLALASKAQSDCHRAIRFNTVDTAFDFNSWYDGWWTTTYTWHTRTIELVVSTTEADSVEITILNIISEVKYTGAVSGTATIDVRGWNPGIYFIRYRCNGSEQLKRFLIRDEIEGSTSTNFK